eukprot:1161439-Pelagomonas_calceolata.AAC.5
MFTPRGNFHQVSSKFDTTLAGSTFSVYVFSGIQMDLAERRNRTVEVNLYDFFASEAAAAPPC